MKLFVTLLARLPRPYHYSNYPERFIRKQTEFIEWKTPPYPNYQPRIVRYRKNAYYDINRPWTTEFQDQNAPNIKHPKIYVEPFKQFPIFLGDIVQVMRGKDREERNWVCVRGLNRKYRLMQRDPSFPGVLNTTEEPLLVPRDVSLVDPEDNQPTTIEWRYDEDGNQVRVSVRTGRVIPIPRKAYETRDYTVPEAYKDQPKDTASDEVVKATFKPKLKTFEMDIMEDHGIQEHRIPYPMYWY
ncbi:39s ribosomal protein l24 [Dermatophagoides farinae]|uniref:39s ribosomal protein l24 n=1 Tax=Dermatophagoides farinae TaxID=6954 RepID=A0A9D4P320_DERFA|nr:39s ribosomal protein l24 [Dermatophagoides farinae]